jgi:hypothetical protein
MYTFHISVYYVIYITYRYEWCEDVGSLGVIENDPPPRGGTREDRSRGDTTLTSKWCAVNSVPLGPFQVIHNLIRTCVLHLWNGSLNNRYLR